MMLQQIKNMENQKTNSKKKATHILKETHIKKTGDAARLPAQLAG